jgi:hypothetical protein
MRFDLTHIAHSSLHIKPGLIMTSSDELTASAMLEIKVQKYTTHLTKILRKYLGSDEQKAITITTIRSSRRGSHEAVGIHVDGTTQQVLVHLGFEKTSTGSHVRPYASLKRIRPEKFTQHGQIFSNAQEIVGLAIAAMQDFGGYNKVANNCQNFNELLLAKLGMQRSDVNDQQFAVAATIGVAAVGAMAITYVEELKCGFEKCRNMFKNDTNVDQPNAMPECSDHTVLPNPRKHVRSNVVTVSGLAIPSVALRPERTIFRAKRH